MYACFVRAGTWLSRAQEKAAAPGAKACCLMFIQALISRVLRAVKLFFYTQKPRAVC